MNRTEWIKQADRLHQSGQPFALVTVLRAFAPTSSKAGDKAVVTAEGLIHGWIGGGCAQPAVIKTVRRALFDGQPRTIRISPSDESVERDIGDVLEFGMACHSGGTLELFVDPVVPAAMLTVVGDSPVARALVSLAPRVGLRVAAVAHGAASGDFLDASAVIDTDDRQHVANQLERSAFVVVATQGRRDVQGLKAALSLQPERLWFVASATKARVVLDALVSSGEPEEAVRRIVAPAGESIGAQTPEEIALSVLASVVAAKRGGAAAVAASPGGAGAVAREAMAADAPLSSHPEASGSGSCCGSVKAANAVAVAPKSCCGG